jgi:hypothetical protein
MMTQLVGWLLALMALVVEMAARLVRRKVDWAALCAPDLEGR